MPTSAATIKAEIVQRKTAHLKRVPGDPRYYWDPARGRFYLGKPGVSVRHERDRQGHVSRIITTSYTTVYDPCVLKRLRRKVREP